MPVDGQRVRQLVQSDLHFGAGDLDEFSRGGADGTEPTLGRETGGPIAGKPD